MEWFAEWLYRLAEKLAVWLEPEEEPNKKRRRR